jgi:hypothetical protein
MGVRHGSSMARMVSFCPSSTDPHRGVRLKTATAACAATAAVSSRRPSARGASTWTKPTRCETRAAWVLLSEAAK